MTKTTDSRLALLARDERRRRRSRTRVRSTNESSGTPSEKATLHRTARKTLEAIDPTKTCAGVREIEGHRCYGRIDCHHRDGNWRNNEPENLCWACRRAHELLDRAAGV